jgi:hypothetical protein
MLPSPRRPTRIASITWSSAFSTMRIPSTMHPRASCSTTGKSVTSTSQWATDYIKRQDGSVSTTTAQSLATTRNKGQTNNLTSSTCTPPPTTLSTHPSTPYPPGSDTCLLALAASFKSFKPLWPILMTGAWHRRSHGTERSTMMSPTWRSRSKSTNATLMLHEQVSCCVSPDLCSHALQNMSRLSGTCPGRWGRYT